MDIVVALDHKVIQTIWTSFGQERLCEVTLPDGTTATRWLRESAYHDLTNYGTFRPEPLRV